MYLCLFTGGAPVALPKVLCVCSGCGTVYIVGVVLYIVGMVMHECGTVHSGHGQYCVQWAWHCI